MMPRYLTVNAYAHCRCVMTHPCGHAADSLLWCNVRTLGALAALLMSARSLEGMKSSSSLSSP